MGKACLLLLVMSERVPAAGLDLGQDAVACGREPTVPGLRAYNTEDPGGTPRPPSLCGAGESTAETRVHT